MRDEFATISACEKEDLFDEYSELADGGMRVAEHFSLALVERTRKSVEYHLHEPVGAVQRGAEFVRGVCEECRSFALPRG